MIFKISKNIQILLGFYVSFFLLAKIKIKVCVQFVFQLTFLKFCFLLISFFVLYQTYILFWFLHSEYSVYIFFSDILNWDLIFSGRSHLIFQTFGEVFIIKDLIQFRHFCLYLEKISNIPLSESFCNSSQHIFFSSVDQRLASSEKLRSVLLVSFPCRLSFFSRQIVFFRL